MNRVPLLSVLLLLGCPPAGDSLEPPPIPKGGDTGDSEVDCSGTAPVITGLEARADGLHELEQGQLFPTMIFEITAEDDDGDLHFMSYELWFDCELDGVVDTTTAASVSGQSTISSTRCGSYSVVLDLSLSSQGNPPYDTWCDFALRVGDEAGLLSEVALVQGAMPKEDGSDPDPYKPDTSG